MKESTLARVRAEIGSGDLYKARDRLHGLLVTYPNDLEIRRLLGEVYWELRYPAMAGRYWYLLESEDPRYVEAKQAFAKMHGGSATEMARAVKFRGDIAALNSSYAQDQLKELRLKVKQETRQTLGARILELVFSFVFLFAFVFFLYGVYSFVTRLF